MRAFKSPFKEMTMKIRNMKIKSLKSYWLAIIVCLVAFPGLIFSPCAGNSIREDVMVSGDGIGMFSSNTQTVKDRAAGQGTMMYSKRVGWNDSQGNESFASDFQFQGNQQLWNQYAIYMDSANVGWKQSLRASNLANFTGMSRVLSYSDSIDTDLYMQAQGGVKAQNLSNMDEADASSYANMGMGAILQGSIIDQTSGKPKDVTNTWANGNTWIIKSGLNISALKKLPEDWLALCGPITELDIKVNGDPFKAPNTTIQPIRTGVDKAK
jgi:hypothetical protein